MRGPLRNSWSSRYPAGRVSGVSSIDESGASPWGSADPSGRMRRLCAGRGTPETRPLRHRCTGFRWRGFSEMLGEVSNREESL
jgi:hypothetical protein